MKKKIVAERLKWLEEKHGKLTPELVVNDAKNPKSPLHKGAGFEWDIDKAAYSNWIDHARHLIASVEYVVRSETKTYTSVYYVRDPRTPTNKQGYVSTETLAADKQWAREAIDLEIKQVLARVERLRALAGALGHAALVEALLVDLAQLEQAIAA